MLPWKDSSLWSWLQTLSFASQRFSGNLIERLHSSLPPILWYFFLLRNSNFKHFWPSTKFIKSKGHFEYTHHPLLPPFKKTTHPQPKLSTIHLTTSHQQLHPHSHRSVLNGNFSAVGWSTGISWTHAGYHSQRIAEGFGHTSGRKWDKVGKCQLLFSVFFHRVLK